MTSTRHPNRTGLRILTSTASDPDQPTGGGAVLGCRCRTSVVAGTVWAYDRRLGWHDPAEHDTWIPPHPLARAPLPAVLQALSPSPQLAPTPAAQSATEPASRRHVLAPHKRGRVVCTRCGLVFDAGAWTRSGWPLPVCQPPATPAPSPSPSASPGSTVHPSLEQNRSPR